MGKHIPVLLDEVVKYLDPQKGKKFIDATYGRGGHSRVLLEQKSFVLGIDRDVEGYNACRQDKNRFQDRLYCVHGDFADIFNIAKQSNFIGVDGVLFDLGLSSPQIEDPKRGFSFLLEGPLDMRFNQKQLLRAEDLVNTLSENELATIIYRYGEERYSRRIAKAIIEARQKIRIKTTFELVEIIKKAVPKKYLHGKIHFATRTFQALRIAVNDELNQLRRGLAEALKVVKKGGKIAVISFHSLEDRIVKRFFLEQKKKNLLEILTKKPIVPAKAEIVKNPRSRSAKLRVAVKS
jgi:16S rRNA (cytosine1402-N4)-methyltransferase